MSAATSMGCRPSFFRRRASLPQKVVLPEPCRPMTMTVAMPLPLAFHVQVQLGRLAAQQGRQLLVDDLDHLLRRRQAAQDILPQGLLPDAGHQLLGHPVVDIGLEESQAHLAQGFLDVVLGQRVLTSQFFHGLVEAFGQFLEQFAPRTGKTHNRRTGPGIFSGETDAPIRMPKLIAFQYDLQEDSHHAEPPGGPGIPLGTGKLTFRRDFGKSG